MNASPETVTFMFGEMAIEQRLLIARNAQLEQQVAALEARVAELEPEKRDETDVKPGSKRRPARARAK